VELLDGELPHEIAIPDGIDAPHAPAAERGDLFIAAVGAELHATQQLRSGPRRRRVDRATKSLAELIAVERAREGGQRRTNVDGNLGVGDESGRRHRHEHRSIMP
jgi:hypothetical protein